jgi:hypothetical protein
MWICDEKLKRVFSLSGFVSEWIQESKIIFQSMRDLTQKKIQLTFLLSYAHMLTKIHIAIVKYM